MNGDATELVGVAAAPRVAAPPPKGDAPTPPCVAVAAKGGAPVTAPPAPPPPNGECCAGAPLTDAEVVLVGANGDAADVGAPNGELLVLCCCVPPTGDAELPMFWLAPNGEAQAPCGPPKGEALAAEPANGETFAGVGVAANGDALAAVALKGLALGAWLEADPKGDELR